MNLNFKRIFVVLTVGAVALLIGVVNAVEFHNDIVVDGDPVILALGEVLLGVVLAVVLLVAAYWIITDAPDPSVSRIGLWTLITTVILGIGGSLVLLSQFIQAEIQWYLIAVNFLGIGVISGIGFGYYDAVQKQQERSIRNERDQFEALFTNVPTAVIAVTQREDRIDVDMVNPAFEKVFGYTKSELDGVDIRNVLRPSDEKPEPISDSSLTGLPDEREGDWTEVQVTLQTEFGLREFVRISAPIDEDGGPEEYAFYIDVTEQLQREERIQVMSRALRHDLRNRLNVIHGNAEMLAEWAKQSELEHTADSIQDAAGDLLALSEQTRTVEKIVGQEYDRRSTVVKDVISSVVSAAKDEYPTAEIDVEVPDLLSVQADPTLEIAIQNVIDNAIVHNDSETPHVEIVAVESPDSSYVDIRIHDNGPGISPDIYSSITEGEMSDSTSHSHGMGLWVVNWITNNLGGELQIDANAPRGTIVTLRLLRADDASIS